MSSGRISSLVILGGVLAAGLAIQATDDDTGGGDEAVLRPGVVQPAASSSGTLSSTWFCAAGTSYADGFADHVVNIMNPTDEPRRAVVTVLLGTDVSQPSEAEAGETTTTPTTAATTSTTRPAPAVRTVDLGPQSRVDVRLGDIAESRLAGAIVEATGGQVVVEHTLTGPRGRATAPCSTTASASWMFPWGVTSRGNRELLVFMNPFPDDATVDVFFSTNEGSREAARFQGFVVPARSVIGAWVEQDSRRDQIATEVTVRGGRLIVDRLQLFDGTDGRSGLNLATGVPAPAETWMFPEGVVDEGLQEQVFVYNPTEDVAEVEVEVRLDDPGEIGPPEPFTLTVSPRRYASVDVHADDRVPAGVGHALIVRSLNGVPVAAERVNSGVAPAPHTGVAVTTGSAFGARTWYFAGGGPTAERDEFIVLFNVSPDEEVTYDLTGLANGQTIAIQNQQGQRIGPGGRAVIRLGDHVGARDALPIVVRASGPIVAERGLHRIGGGGISQAVGIMLNDDSVVIPDPLEG